MKYKLAIFDSDGTLADTLPWMRSVFNELADEHGFRRVEPHEYEQFRDLHGTALLKALGLPLWKLPPVVSAMRKKMASHITQFAPFPGVAGMLQRLSACGVQLGVVSSNSRANVEHILGPRAAGLVNHFGLERQRGFGRSFAPAESRAVKRFTSAMKSATPRRHVRRVSRSGPWRGDNTARRCCARSSPLSSSSPLRRLRKYFVPHMKHENDRRHQVAK